MSQAEIKSFKLGETLPSNVGGNPEPSSSENSERACVETRQRVCIHCNNVITNPRKGLKYCSPKCRSAYISYRWSLKNKKFKKPGVGSGGNQKSKRNHMYKNGIGIYHKLAFDEKEHTCERCGSKKIYYHTIRIMIEVIMSYKT
jgi:DNA-directed RNA polymerase subunit M/transcription elongation factor TFIIS